MFDEFEIEQDAKDKPEANQARALFESKKSLGAVITDWLKPGRQVELGPGVYDADDPAGPSTCLIATLKADKENIASLSAPISRVLECFPGVVPIAAFEAKTERPHGHTCDNEAVEKDRARYNIRWNDNLNQDEVSFESGLEIALGYAISEVGTAWLAPYTLDEDYEPIPVGGLVQLDMHYQNIKTGIGWGEYLVLRS